MDERLRGRLGDRAPSPGGQQQAAITGPGLAAVIWRPAGRLTEREDYAAGYCGTGNHGEAKLFYVTVIPVQ